MLILWSERPENRFLEQKGFAAVAERAKTDPIGAVDSYNDLFGGDLEYRGKKGDFMEVGSEKAGKVYLFNPIDGETKEFDFPAQEAKPTTLQKNLEAAGLQPGTPAFKKAILQSMQKPGQSFKVDSEGNVELLTGPGVGTQQKTTKKGFEFVDKEFAKDFVEWRVRGGSADAFKQIGQLEQALDNLESGQNLTGPIAGLTPDVALNVFNSEAINTEELVTEVVQRNLRVVLGAQFTEKEGERLIKRAYNRNLEEAVNAKRVKRLINQIKIATRKFSGTIKIYDQIPIRRPRRRFSISQYISCFTLKIMYIQVINWSISKIFRFLARENKFVSIRRPIRLSTIISIRNNIIHLLLFSTI